MFTRSLPAMFCFKFMNLGYEDLFVAKVRQGILCNCIKRDLMVSNNRLKIRIHDIFD